MAQRKAEGLSLGRLRALPAEVVERITAARSAGLSFAAIALALNADGVVPTAQGGRAGYRSTVRHVTLELCTP
jgi:hypothetical protein